MHTDQNVVLVYKTRISHYLIQMHNLYSNSFIFWRGIPCQINQKQGEIYMTVVDFGVLVYDPEVMRPTNC